jgi:hypothetical protein
LLKFDSLKEFDLSKAWDSISSRPEIDRQALAMLLEKTAVTGY